MGRYPQVAATKGSQRWLQVLVNERRDVIDSALSVPLSGRKLSWLSPLRTDEFAEYRDNEALKVLGLDPSRVPLASFWPNQGPQWDALATTEDGAAILVEAKAHVGELASSMAATAPASVDRIRSALAECAKALGISAGPAWTERFYQYANRLAHAHFLRALNGLPVQLVFIYFIGDPDVAGPDTVQEWKQAVEAVQASLGLLGRMPTYVHDVYVHTRDFLRRVS
jgi:hypothetical protein